MRQLYSSVSVGHNRKYRLEVRQLFILSHTMKLHGLTYTYKANSLIPDQRNSKVDYNRESLLFSHPLDSIHSPSDHWLKSTLDGDVHSLTARISFYNL